MKTSFEWNKHLREKLLTIPIIKEKKVGIYPLVVEQGTKYPYIIISRDNIFDNTQTKDYYRTDTIHFSIVCYTSDDYKLSVDIIKEVREHLNHSWQVEDNEEKVVFKGCRLLEATEGYEEESYYQSVTFKIDTEYIE